jgi:hypothetical protein
MWDLNEAMSVIEKKKMARKNSGGDAAEAADDDDAQSAIVHPAAMGHIDTSHKRMIADMCWLEPDAQVNSKGKLLAEEHLDGKSYQFMTIAGDGQALIWDIRYNEIAKGNLPHVNKPKMSAAMTAAMEKAAKVRPPARARASERSEPKRRGRRASRKDAGERRQRMI